DTARGSRGYLAALDPQGGADRTNDSDQDGCDDEQQPDDSQLAERFEVERMRELAEQGYRPVLKPPGLVGTCATAVQRMRPELGDRSPPELPAPAAGAAEQVALGDGGVRRR